MEIGVGTLYRLAREGFQNSGNGFLNLGLRALALAREKQAKKRETERNRVSGCSVFKAAATVL